MKLRSESGQTIIEAVVALAAIFIVVTAITAAIVTALNNSRFVKDQNLASKYAQQGIDIVRELQTGEYAPFKNYTGTYSLPEGTDTLSSGRATNPNIGNDYIRNVKLENNVSPCLANSGIGLKKVTVIVSWSSGKCPSGPNTEDRFCHNSTQVTCVPYETDPNAQP